MPTIILLNHVHLDGMGDFSHLTDIYQALINNPKLAHYTFVPVVSAAPKQYEKVKKRLLQLNPPHYFFAADNQELEQNAELQHYLGKAEQVILISHGDFPRLAHYKKHFHPQALLKFIGEHESPASTTRPLQENGWMLRSLGLSKNCYGLKLIDEPRLQPAAALSIMAEEKHQPFLTALLQQSGSITIDHFVEKNDLIPAYFNHHGLEGFLYFLALNPELSPGKNSAIYLSGDHSFEHGFALLKNTSVQQIEIIRPDGQDKAIYPLNPKSDRIIRIFYGFQLTDSAYRAIYQQAPYAGVSGDNTFEKAISHKLFPFYHSTNFSMKRPSLLALASIINQLNLPDKLKADYIFYFQYINLFSNTFLGLKNAKRRLAVMRFGLDPHRRLDFTAMIASWPFVAEHLLQHNNFYDRLETILLEKLNPDLHRQNIFEEKEYNPPAATHTFLLPLQTAVEESQEPADPAFTMTRQAILVILNNYKKARFKAQDRINNVDRLIRAVANKATNNAALLSLLEQASQDAQADDARVNRGRCCRFFTRNLTGSRYQAALENANDLILRQYM